MYRVTSWDVQSDHDATEIQCDPEERMSRVREGETEVQCDQGEPVIQCDQEEKVQCELQEISSRREPIYRVISCR